MSARIPIIIPLSAGLLLLAACPDSTDNTNNSGLDAAVPVDSSTTVDSGNTGDTAPGDTVPGDTVPGDTVPGDTGPADTGPVDTGPADGSEEVADGECTDGCDTENATRCNGDNSAVETCAQNAEGCLEWQVTDTCDTPDHCVGGGETCDSGECLAVPAPAQGPCAGMTVSGPCFELICDPGSGDCSEVAVAPETPCDDGDVCTEDDICFDGACVGFDDCPKACWADPGDIPAWECGESAILTLNAGGTNSMDAYGCDGGAADYSGFERAFSFTSNFDCGVNLFVELTDPLLAGSEHVDAIFLGADTLDCDPSDCQVASLMDDSGRTMVPHTLTASETVYLVVDGAANYNGQVRVAAHCDCGGDVEGFCGDDVDNDGDGQIDCYDIDCTDFPACSNTEWSCTDDVDNDDNGLTDCEDGAQCGSDPACQGPTGCDPDNVDCQDPACATNLQCVSQCPDAPVITCGDSVMVTPTGTEDFTFSGCPTGTGYAVNDLAVSVVQPDCVGGYTVTVTPSGDAGGFLDMFLFGPDCDGSQCIEASTTFGAAESVTLTTQEAPHSWLVVSGIDGNANSHESYTVSVSCSCAD